MAKKNSPARHKFIEGENRMFDTLQPMNNLEKIFTIDDKSDLDKFRRSVTLTAQEFTEVFYACANRKIPYLHEGVKHNFTPENLILTENDLQSIKNGHDNKKTLTKLIQSDKRQSILSRTFIYAYE